MRALFTALVTTAALVAPAAAFAQGAWDYVELLRSETSESAGDRWFHVASSGCAGAQGQGQDCLALTLPKELVGDREVEIVLTGARRTEANTLWTLSGDLGEAACARGPSGSSCLLSLKNLAIDAQAVTDYLTATVADPAERARRAGAAADFRSHLVLRYWHGFR